MKLSLSHKTIIVLLAMTLTFVCPNLCALPGPGEAIDISTAAGASVDYNSIHTPNGVNFYIPNTGSYIVTFTLPNNDVYYGEFEVTD